MRFDYCSNKLNWSNKTINVRGIGHMLWHRQDMMACAIRSLP
jgi:hypothetical protein